MSIIEKLTEGIISRNVQKEGQALLNKWEKTGLLEGIEKDQSRQTMACLLENQAKELLREASTMQAGDVEGFAAVAFPIVRRVFGGLIANELVSVQPMSLPSGLIFFLDFTYNQARFGNINASIYGGGKVGQEITGGVDLATPPNDESSFYNLNNGYASATGSASTTTYVVASGTFGGGAYAAKPSTSNVYLPGISGVPAANMTQTDFDRLCRFDADFISGTTTVVVLRVNTGSAAMDQLNTDDLIPVSSSVPQSTARGHQVRRLSAYSGSDKGLRKPSDPKSDILVYFASINGTQTTDQLVANFGEDTLDVDRATGNTATWSWTQTDDFGGTPAAGSSDALGAVVGTTAWGLENNAGIPEIDIKVDSVSITAMTKKLKAKWTPELQQDINAYHNLDAEVELTGILSETIALEIDQEILEDLIIGATAGTYYWSRKPGKFVNRASGVSTNESLYPDFTGTVSEWYETLLETVNDISAQIHRKTLRGGANFLVTSPEIANVMEFTSGFRADTTADENKGTAGAVKVGQISKKWDVYVDPYFPRNLILVGRKGNSFLESGYVYAPYVPLQVTPTIFGTEDFVPRKGVMTRYGKKMVRPDMYGLVVVEDLI
jgi:hypothetical protein